MTPTERDAARYRILRDHPDSQWLIELLPLTLDRELDKIIANPKYRGVDGEPASVPPTMELGK